MPAPAQIAARRPLDLAAAKSRAKSKAARSFIIAAALLLLAASAPALVACHAAKPPDARDWWSWREVEHRRCWYAGTPGVSKAALFWPAAAARQTQSLPAPALPLPVAPAPAAAPPVRSTPFAERWPR
jgi:hypothetical protein